MPANPSKQHTKRKLGSPPTTYKKPLVKSSFLEKVIALTNWLKNHANFKIFRDLPRTLENVPWQNLCCVLLLSSRPIRISKKFLHRKIFLKTWKNHCASLYEQIRHSYKKLVLRALGINRRQSSWLGEYFNIKSRL